MEALLQFMMDISGNHISRYGIYLPWGSYWILLWNDVVIIFLLLLLVILIYRYVDLKYDGKVIWRIVSKSEQNRECMKEVYKHKHLVGKKGLYVLNEALGSNKIILVRYRDIDENIADRIIQPRIAFWCDITCFIVVYCFKSNMRQTLMLDRIIDIKPLEDPYGRISRDQERKDYYKWMYAV